MFARSIELLIAVSALLYMDHVSGQCISTPYVSWHSCGVPHYANPQSCDRADVFFHIYRETNCVSSNPVVTLDFTAPIATSGDAYGYVEGDSTSISGDVSDDQLSITFDMGEAGLDPFYVLTETQDHYYWYFWVILDNCDTAYTWSDNFVQLSYVDDEQNIIDLTGFEDPNIDETDTGTCCEYGSRATPSPVAPTPVTDATPAPTPAPTMRGAYCHGDPHCQTFDGLYYDCHGDGDFVLLESADTGAVVHARFEPLISPDASFTTGVAATEDGSSVIEVTVSDGERTILIDGEAYAYNEGDDLPATMTGVALTVTDQNVDMLFPSGLQVNARRWFTDPNYIGGVYVFAPLDMATVGVLGTNNGNRADDWTDSTGETIDAALPSVAEGYNYCTSNWEVEESLLTTPSRLRSRRLQTSDYVAPVIPDVIPTDVEELCGDNTECIFDAIVVGLDVGAATLEAGQEFETEVQAAGGDVCEENTFSSNGLSPCTDCPEGETSGRGAVVCEGTVPVEWRTQPPTPSPTVIEEPPTPNPTPSPVEWRTQPPTPSPTVVEEPPTPNPTPSPVEWRTQPPTPSPTPGPSTTTGFTPVSLGCYEDDREDRILDDLALSDGSMTTEVTKSFWQTCRSVIGFCRDGETQRHACGDFVVITDRVYRCSCGTVTGYINRYHSSNGDVFQVLATGQPTQKTSALSSWKSLMHAPTCDVEGRPRWGFHFVGTLSLIMCYHHDVLCELTCLGSTYFATQYGRECWCGSAGVDYALHGESTDCTYACAGDAVQTCGGFDAANVYRYTDESTPNPTPSPAATGPLALGCYVDDREDRIMDDLALSDYSMTTEMCEQTCLGSTYFATQYGRECWCGSASVDYALHGESTDCTYACAGDDDQTCGGFDAANVYRYYTDESTPTSSFIGCYQDESDARIMELALTDSSSMTKEICEAECTGNTYFGMQYGKECFCGGSSTDLLEHGESSACNYECSGDSDQACGGFYAMSVYSYHS
ncbi:unnamed protein product [Ectocarpus sp. 12 AP-2014]